MTYAGLIWDAAYVVSYNIILLLFCVGGLIAAKKAWTPLPWLLIGGTLYAVLYVSEFFYSTHVRNTLICEILVSLLILFIYYPKCLRVYKDKKKEKAAKKIEKNKSTTETQTSSNNDNGGWRCVKCGKVHFAYESSCSCGASKFDVEKREPVSEPITTKNMPPEENAYVPEIGPQRGTAPHRNAICSNCGATLPEGAKFCANCGSKVVALPAVKYCRFCGSKIQEGSKFCPQCGNRVDFSLPGQNAAQDEKEAEYSKEIEENSGDEAISTAVSQGRNVNSVSVSAAFSKLSSEQKTRFFPGQFAQAKKVIESFVYLLGDRNNYARLLELYITIAARVAMSFDSARIVPTVEARFSDLVPHNKTITLIECASRLYQDFAFLQKANTPEYSSFEKSFDQQHRDSYVENERNADDAIKLPYFGTSIENPIYAHSAAGSYNYLNKLYTADLVPLTWDRAGSIIVNSSKDPIDQYELLLPDGTAFQTLYVNMYSRETSQFYPKGLYSAGLREARGNAAPDTN